ncbi:luciferase family protein [Streptomyces sp. L7]
MQRLTGWPDLEVRARPVVASGQALRSVHSEIVHFHSDHDVGPASHRRGHPPVPPPISSESTAIRIIPEFPLGDESTLDCETDVDLLLSRGQSPPQGTQAGPPSGNPPMTELQPPPGGTRAARRRLGPFQEGPRP